MKPGFTVAEEMAHSVEDAAKRIWVFASGSFFWEAEAVKNRETTW